MADLNTAQKVSVHVTDANGNEINEALQQGDVFTDDVDILTIEHGNFGQIYAIAQSDGQATIGVTHASQSGHLLVTVAAGELTVTLGSPVPK